MSILKGDSHGNSEETHQDQAPGCVAQEDGHAHGPEGALQEETGGGALEGSAPAEGGPVRPELHGEEEGEEEVEVITGDTRGPIADAVFAQIDATLNHPDFDLHLSASEGPQLTYSEVLRSLDCRIVHFPSKGDFVFVKHPFIEGEFTVHTIFAGHPFDEVLKCCRVAARLMAHNGLDALASYCPTLNRGAQALCRGMGMTPIHQMPFGAVWGGMLPDLLGKDRELMARAEAYAVNRMPRKQVAALAAALHLLGDPTEKPATPWRRELLRRIVFMLSEVGPVAQVPVGGQQHILFGEAGVIIPVGPLV